MMWAEDEKFHLRGTRLEANNITGQATAFQHSEPVFSDQI